MRSLKVLNHRFVRGLSLVLALAGSATALAEDARLPRNALEALEPGPGETRTLLPNGQVLVLGGLGQLGRFGCTTLPASSCARFLSGCSTGGATTRRRYCLTERSSLRADGMHLGWSCPRSSGWTPRPA